MGRKIMFATLAAAALAGACSRSAETPTAPSVEAIQPAASSSTTLHASAFDQFLRTKVTWSQGDDTLTAIIANPPYDVEPKILLQVNDRGVSPQVMLAWSSAKHVTRGEPISWTAGPLPCGRQIEGELYVSDEPVANDKISGGYLVAFFFGETPACSTPRPRPTPPCQGECCPTEGNPNPCPSPTPSPSPTPYCEPGLSAAHVARLRSYCGNSWALVITAGGYFKVEDDGGSVIYGPVHGTAGQTFTFTSSVTSLHVVRSDNEDFEDGRNDASVRNGSSCSCEVD